MPRRTVVWSAAHQKFHHFSLHWARAAMNAGWSAGSGTGLPEYTQSADPTVSFSLPHGLRSPLDKGLRSESCIHSYPGVRGGGGRKPNSRGHRGIIRVFLVPWSGIAGRCVSPIFIRVAITAGIRVALVHVRSRHGRLCRAGIRRLRRRIRGLVWGIRGMARSVWWRRLIRRILRRIVGCG